MLLLFIRCSLSYCLIWTLLSQLVPSHYNKLYKLMVVLLCDFFFHSFKIWHLLYFYRSLCRCRCRCLYFSSYRLFFRFFIAWLKKNCMTLIRKIWEKRSIGEETCIQQNDELKCIPFILHIVHRVAFLWWTTQLKRLYNKEMVSSYRKKLPKLKVIYTNNPSIPFLVPFQRELPLLWHLFIAKEKSKSFGNY